MVKIHRENCPICRSTNLIVDFTGKDYSHTGEVFNVVTCVECDFKFTQNVPDADSIGPYYKSENYVSHSDKQEGLFFKIYHLVRNYMLGKKRKMLSQKKGKLLDIGCGTGYFLNEMKQHQWEVTGIEQDEQARNYGAEKFNVKVFPTHYMEQIGEKEFDAITLWHVLEHVHDLNGYLKVIKKALRKTGEVLIAVPNHTSYDALKYKEHWAAWDLPIHLWHFSPKNMEDLLAQHQLKIVKHFSLPFDAFYVSLLSEKYRGGSALKALFIGTASFLNSLFNPKQCSSVVYLIKHQY